MNNQPWNAPGSSILMPNDLIIGLFSTSHWSSIENNESLSKMIRSWNIFVNFHWESWGWLQINLTSSCMPTSGFSVAAASLAWPHRSWAWREARWMSIRPWATTFIIYFVIGDDHPSVFLIADDFYRNWWNIFWFTNSLDTMRSSNLFSALLLLLLLLGRFVLALVDIGREALLRDVVAWRCVICRIGNQRCAKTFPALLLACSLV